MNFTKVRSRFSLSSPKSKLLQIECLEMLTLFLLFLLLTTRFLRRQYNSTVLRFLALGPNTTILLLIPFIFGLMLNLDFKNDFVPVWATFLVFVYASVPDIVDFHRGLHVGVAFVKFSLYAIYSCLLVFRIKYSLLKMPMIVFLGVSLYQTMEKMSAPAVATSITNEARRTGLLRSISKYLQDRLNEVDNTPASGDDPLPRCTYLVDPKIRKICAGKTDDPGITLDKIWSCKDGSLLSSAGGQEHELKNTCLAFSLFWMLLPNFAGVPSYEPSQPEAALKFIQDGLLIEIIEIELAFRGDFFIGKYFCAFYDIGLLVLLVRQSLVLFAVGLAVCTIYMYYGLVPEIHGHDREVLVTGIGIILISMPQVGKAIVLCNSRWAKMKLICLYVRQESWKKKTIGDRCIITVAHIICPVRYQLFKPWQRKLWQYSLLHSCTYMQSFRSMFSRRMLQSLTGIRLGRPGRKESDAQILSDEIQMIVIQCLRDRGSQLTSGIGSLEDSNLPPHTQMKLILKCKPSSKLDTDGRVVLVWHIATSICEINPRLPSTARQCSDFRVATTLSMYCAYLVTFVPDLLPGHAAATTFSCSDAIDDAYERLKDCGSLNYDKLMEIANEDRDELEAIQRQMDTSIVKQGAVLGKLLETEIAEGCQRWKLLADLWAEMILYLAPNATNQWAHVEKLEDGIVGVALPWWDRRQRLFP